MNWQPLQKIAYTCFAAAAVAAAFALLGFSSPSILPAAAWLMVAVGAVFAGLGIHLQAESRTVLFHSERAERESRSLQTRLEQQQRSIDALADGLDVSIFMCDLRGIVLYANQRAQEMFRLENPLSRSILAVTLSYDLEQLVLDAARTGSPREAELTFSFPEERVGVVRAWVPDEDSNRTFISVFEITPLRRLERVRQDFVSNVSHELRTPLTVIRAMAETLLDEKPAQQEQLERYLPRIIVEVDRLASLTNDLLLLSAAESNTVRKSRCDLADVFRTVVQQLMPKATAKGLVLKIEAPDHLWIEANSAQMSQVAINLVDNAINYTTQGEIDIVLEQRESEVLVRVSDTGIGVASEHAPRIFERFYRVDRGRSRSTGGTGLGLSIVKHIIEAHGGVVTLDSALNRGSTFMIRLPVGDLSHAAPES